ncbi:MAG: hypothetical protein RLZZ273_1599, partial [Bacteroidota bacterium]
AVLTSVRKTNRCMVLHEDTMTAGFGAEIASVIMQECFSYLDAPVCRLASADVPIPYNKGMMDAVIPTIDTVASELRALIEW